MEIALQNVMPDTLHKEFFAPESLWKNEYVLSPGNHYLVKADSGTGKSTFINILYGIRRDFSGVLQMDRKNISAFSLKEWSELRQKKISIVFQDLRLFDPYTVRENILLKQQQTNSVALSEIDEWMEILQISHKKNSSCKHLSLGQQQRVAILRALSQPFRWLLLDEPFSHLDEKNIELASELILAQLKKNNAGLILTGLGDNQYFHYDQVIPI